MRAGTSFSLCCYLDVRDSHREPLQQIQSERWVLFPCDWGKPNTGTYTNKINFIQIYMLCFPVHCVTSFRDPLDLETNCISLDFISNGSVDIFHNYVKALSFVDSLPKEWKASYLSTVAACTSQQYWEQIYTCSREIEDLFLPHVFVPFKIILNHYVYNLTLYSFSKATVIRKTEIGDFLKVLKFLCFCLYIKQAKSCCSPPPLAPCY